MGSGLSGEEAGAFLAERFLARPRLAAAIERLIDDAEAEIQRRGYGDIILRQDSRLQALQLFDHAVRRDPGIAYNREDYRQAAGIVREAGYPKRALILDEFGDIVDNARLLEHDVEQFHRLWAARHATWAQAASGRARNPVAGLLREHGRVWRGVDGAAYTHADCAGPPGTARSAVAVRNSAGQAETVAFGDRAAARVWLASRARDGTGPLPTTADGPACRTAWEEAVLARLLRDPHDDQLRALAAERAWTSHLRAELHLAMRPGHFLKHPDQNQVRSSFAHRMLRAPGWALSQIGWPDAHHAMRYLDRLAVTPVTAAQALAAAQALVSADVSRTSRLLPSQTRRTLDAPSPRPYPARATPPLMLVPPPPLPGPITPVPRR